MAMPAYNIRTAVASSLDVLRITRFLLALQERCIPGGYIRAINYHGTPVDTAGQFERQLAFYARHFSSVSLQDLEAFLDGRRWDKVRPGLIISFDDGLYSNYAVAAPLLEKHGFRGWFFIPVDFVAVEPSEQRRFAETHQIRLDGTVSPDGRVAMSWAELRDLHRRNHVIGCHTRTHRRMSPGLPDAVLEYEICAGKALLEESLGSTCDCYCWVGGEEWTYTADAARAIRSAGYRYSFTTNSFPVTRAANGHRLDRSNVESEWSLARASFELCGLQDVRSTPARRRVARTIDAA